MEIFEKKSQLSEFLLDFKKNKKAIGFVPTMGALHKGHLSLIAHAKKKNDVVVVSIFVNPTQFDNKEDLKNYPKTLKNDIDLLKSVACDVLYVPDANDVYDNTIASETFNFDGLENQMEGKFRDGHFDGVGTIVKKLFEIVTPDRAYFGEKDFQQLQIIKKLVEKHKIPVKVKGRPIFREEDGLAFSSRNARLTPEHREEASFIYRTIKKAKRKTGFKNVQEIIAWVQKQFEKNPLLELEYFTIADEDTLETAVEINPNKEYRGFIAAYAGKIRLIDNIRF